MDKNIIPKRKYSTLKVNRPPQIKNQNTMLTNDNIIYFLNIKYSKERVYTNWLFFVSLKLILKFFAG